MNIKNCICFSLFIAVTPFTFATEFDFDGDGLADLAIRRPADGTQMILNSSGTDFGSELEDNIQRYGIGNSANDIPVSGDFDGDGIADVGVRRPKTFEWIIRHSSTGRIVTTVFGQGREDIPVPADYDGDGITDMAVRRPETQIWYIRNSSGIDEITQQDDGITRLVFGRKAEDIPVVKDYDGDGKADLAVWRPSNQFWYIKNSAGTDIVTNNTDGITRFKFGEFATDMPVPADYNADGKADMAVRRPPNFTWYVRNSDNSNFNSSALDGIQRIVFGKNESDIPVVADYDGDGIADVAVRRISNQHFYIRNSSGENLNSENEDGIQRVNFGESSDIAVNADPLHRFMMATSIESDITQKLIHESFALIDFETLGKKLIVAREQSVYERELALRSDDTPMTIDFEQESVVILDAGARQTGGFTINLSGITEFNDYVELEVETIVPDYTCGVTLAFTQPVTFYRLNTVKELVFKETRVYLHCAGAD